MGLSLFDISDRELLFRLDDVADNEGLATSQELVDALGLKSVDSRNVSSRLSWLKRYGAVETAATYRQGDNGRYKVKAWRLSPDGEKFIFTNMNARQRQSVEGIKDENLVETVALITSRYQFVNPTAKNLLRRQWQAGTFIGRRM